MKNRFRSTEEIISTIESELEFLFSRLREFPKCYWIWNHRKWCLTTSPKPNYKYELKLVTLMLERDARNFHGWQYRRAVVASIEKMMKHPGALDKSEFAYTTAKINNNFSNFSAWHNRTKLIPRMLIDDPDLDGRELLKKGAFVCTLLLCEAVYADKGIL